MLEPMRLRPFVVAIAGLIIVAQSTTTARQESTVVRSPRNASYTLKASLDPATHTITGSGRLRWRNISRVPATELRFHLYWNAWRNNRSTWMRERALGRNDDLAQRPPEERGWIDLATLTLAGAGSDRQDLLQRARFIAPDDGNTDDQTVLAVGLDHAVGPGDTIDLDLGWTSHVPRTFARTGVLGRYYFIGQWFPKIGVLDDSGWNCHQFHAATEFFADFGVYDVALTVPTGWVVGATGLELSSAASGSATTTHRFLEEDVHDFAWTTSPSYLDSHRIFNEPGLPRVDMRLLLQPEHAAQAERHFTSARTALKYYGTWFGAYPYNHITIVDPVTTFNVAAQGESTGGMEYPTLLTAGTRYFAPRNGLSPESVTIHEAGHQFWYGVVATNEFEHAWMDEGFNSYSQGRAIAEGLPATYVTVGRYFGGLAAWPFEDVRWSRDIDQLNTFRPRAGDDRQSTPTWQYWPGSASATTYSKTALWLTTLERYLSWPVVQRIMSTHFARGAFRHPTPEEFFAIANEVSGQDLTWFFDAVHRSSAVFDYGVAQVTSAAETGPLIDTSVVVRRFGDGSFPVDVRVTFSNGSSVVERWDGRDRWHAFRYRKPESVARVEVDPNRVLLLDVNYTNNSWTVQPKSSEAATKWTLRWLMWAEEVLLTYGFFA
jgi:hypothetical protein